MPSLHSTAPFRPAILFAVGASAAPQSGALEELRSLVTDLGYSVVGQVRQRRPMASAALPLGSGKLKDLEELVRTNTESPGSSVLVVAAHDLASGHLRNLERALDTPVIDRTELILRIFETRAESQLAKLEIERARLVHSLPRIRDLDAARRQQGGGGRAAKGHSNTELAKRAAADRIAVIGRHVESLRRQQERRAERRHELPRVALVGYTNVGKSSWMQVLTARDAGIKDQLFHTLGTRVHALHDEGTRILLADTVGFIAGIPHTLLESFRSTLVEALDADLRLHIADANSPRLHEQLAVTAAVIREVEAPDVPELLLLNKIDLVSSERREELRQAYPHALFVSSHSEDDRRTVTLRIRELVAPAG